MKRQAVSGAVVLGVILASEQVGEYDASETSGLSTIRAIQAAEGDYAAMHGHYVDPACLARGSCSGGENHSPLLSPWLEGLIQRRGFHFEFHAGPPDGTSPGATRQLPGFAVVVRPIATRGVDGFSAFCGDDSNRIYRVNATAPAIAIDGRCQDRSDPIRSSR